MSTSRAMRDSTLDWLGLIPEAWELKPFFTVCSELNNKNKGMKESNLLSLSYGNIVLKDIDSNEGLLPESFEGYQIVEPDDLVFRFTDLQNDQRSLRSAISEYNGIITSAYLAVRPHDAIPKYLAYLMRAYDQLKVFYSMGGGLRQAMNFQDVKRLPIPVPTLAEQQAIVEFLDRETAHTDTLVEKQLRLVEALNERKRAFISHMIDQQTKNHPKIRLRHLVEINPSGGFVQSLSDDALVTFMPMERLHENGEISADLTRELIEVKGSYSLFQEGDVVVAKVTPCFENGKSAVATNLMNRVAYGTTEITVLRPRPELLATYLRYVVSSSRYLDEGTASMTGAGGLKRVPENFVRNFKIGLPPTREQEYLVSSLDAKLKRMDQLVKVANQTTALLRERRQALISAAVTGKIDVRGK